MTMPNIELAADWIMDRMVNRVDACGAYYRSGGKVMLTTCKKSDDNWIDLPERIVRHLAAKTCDDLLGLHSTSTDQTSKWLAFDIDAHDHHVDRDANRQDAMGLFDAVGRRGFTPHLFDSNGDGGYHLFVYFDEPAPTHRVYELGRILAMPFDNVREWFPKQPSIKPHGYGNWIRLPGRHHKREYQTKYFNGEGWAQSVWDYLLTIEPDSTDNLPDGEAVKIPKKDNGHSMHGEATASEIAAVIERLKSIAPATEGNGGDDHTIKVCNFVLDYGLSNDQAMIAMADWDRRCNPPWGDELRTKLENARQYRQNPIGWRATDDSFGQWGEPKKQAGLPKKTSPKISEVVANGFCEITKPRFPAGVAVFCERAASGIGCSPVQIEAHVLAILANAIGTSRRIELKKGWQEPAIVWTAVVNRSGEKKSPSLNAALIPIRAMQREAMREHEQSMLEYNAAMVQHEIDLKRFKSRSTQSQGSLPEQPTKPTATRYFTNDSTIEALAGLIRDNPRGIAEIRDELSGLFDFGRYTASGNAEIARYLEMFNGNDVYVDRKGDGCTFIPKAQLCISGTIQDGILAKCLAGQHWENGLAARFLFVKPPRVKQRWQAQNDLPEYVVEAYSAIVRRLYELQPGTHPESGEQYSLVRRLSDDAMDVWADFYNEHAEVVDCTDGDLAKCFAKLEGYAARFALIWHCTDWACNSDQPVDPEEISADAMRFGVDLARWFRHEVARVYEILAEDGPQRRMRELLELTRCQGGNITRRQLMTLRRAEYPDSASAKSALDGLVEAGLATYQPKAGPGRPSDAYTLTQNTKPPIPLDGKGFCDSTIGLKAAI